MSSLGYRKRSKITAVLSLLLLFHLSAFAKAKEPNVPIEVQDYTLALKEFQSRPNRQPIEPVYALGTVAANKLVLVLEKLNSDEFNLVEDRMHGFVVNREEAIYVRPNTDFWKNLAKQKGQNVDIAFFNLLHWIKPRAWPVYIKQLDDVSGCTKYGSGLLVDVYGKLQQFQQIYSSAYKVHIEEISSDIEGKLTFDSRSCGTAADIINELQLFITAYPDSDISKKLKQRIHEIEKTNK